MTQKMLCLCAAAALLFVFATANVSSAQDPIPAPSAPLACPCEFASIPCQWGCARCCVPGCPAVTYRVGLFGAIRPVVYAPVYRPVYTARLAPRYVCPPPYMAPRAVYAPYCW